MNSAKDTQAVKKTLRTKSSAVSFYHLAKITKLGLPDPSRLPFSIKVLLECALRNYDGYQITFKDIETLSGWTPHLNKKSEVAFKPGRVILQDFTGVPCVVDLAAMRSAMKRLGGDDRKINPRIPCDLIIDHSLQVDAFASKKAMEINVSKEFKRNRERYEFLKWGQGAFKNFRVIPPSVGIIHQINLEYLAKGVLKTKTSAEVLVYPDSLVGTDSHTTMINGLGIVGWGVGGLEAEAVMLGEPLYLLLPDVVGFRLSGRLKQGVNATDLVLTITQMLRQRGVVGTFVEFYGEGVGNLSLPDRATISNMCPEYGATIGIFPIDGETLSYYKMTGRKAEEVDLLERYMKEQGMFAEAPTGNTLFTDTLELDLTSVEPCLAGPKRPQDRIPLSEMKRAFSQTLTAPVKGRGYGLNAADLKQSAVLGNTKTAVTHGSVVIAAITSCTNTSNPSLLIGAGILARNASEKGLKVSRAVKTSFTPGSPVVEEYLRQAGLIPYFEKLGFHIVGYGCATCIGNSGPLPEDVARAVRENNLVAASVLSGNRNFEGRINPLTRANYLCSPALVIAYALAGRVDIDLTTEPIGRDEAGQAVYLNDIWPDDHEINQMVLKFVKAKAFHSRYKNIAKGNKNWNEIKAPHGDLYAWNSQSTYIQEPPFFTGMTTGSAPIRAIRGARVLVMAGDSVTTDHISPAGDIAVESPAGLYLKEIGVKPADFNSYGSRRGNDQVMTRGTFANIRFRNLLVPGSEGSRTIYFPKNETLSIFDAALSYKKDGIPLIVLAGSEYGTGSSRDWAAKGTALLGVRAVLAKSFERIHRSNLAGMGILPLEFKPGDSVEALGLTGSELFDFTDIGEGLKPRQDIAVVATSHTGAQKRFTAVCRLDTPVEVDYFRHGGILPAVLRKLLKTRAPG